MAEKFGRLTFLEEIGAKWRVRCDCGVEKLIPRKAVLRKDKPTLSCGCLQRDAAARTGRELNRRHGAKDTPTWRTWSSMRNRCANPRNVAYAKYGARGVTVCSRWETFENFLADMGERPAGTTIDRIDNAGNYEPGNCRWATDTTQARNRRSNLILATPRGPLTLVEAAQAYGLRRDTLRHRLNAGWPIEEALSAPVTPRSQTNARRLRRQP